MTWLELPLLKLLLPLPILAGLAPLVWRVFRGPWRELEASALQERVRLAEAGRIDWRPVAAAVLGAAVLTALHFFGTRDYFDQVVAGRLGTLAAFRGGGALDRALWGPFLGQAWWAVTHVLGYLTPFAAWRLLFPAERLLDHGLRLRGFRQHAWIYAACVAVVLPLVLVAQRQPDFGAAYPFYKAAGRSWLDFGLWEGLYLAQFLSLELFFRGWWVRASRSLGVASIFAAAVPYGMIHFNKPYLEAMGAIVAGVVLGSVAVKTRSVWAGFLLHATVALTMDVLSLSRRHALPVRLAPGSLETFSFEGWWVLGLALWLGALALLAVEARRRWPALAAWARRPRSGGGLAPG